MLDKDSEILITGGAGFIGYHTANYYLRKKFKVVVIDNLSNYYSTSLKNKRIDLLKKYDHFTFYKKDILNYQSIKKILKNIILS